MTERSILELGVGVDHEVVVANSRKVSTSGREANVLNESFTDSQLFDVLRLHHFAVFAALVSTGKELQVKGRYLVLFDPDNLAVGERGQRILLSNLDHHCALIEAKSYSVCVLHG